MLEIISYVSATNHNMDINWLTLKNASQPALMWCMFTFLIFLLFIIYAIYTSLPSYFFNRFKSIKKKILYVKHIKSIINRKKYFYLLKNYQLKINLQIILLKYQFKSEKKHDRIKNNTKILLKTAIFNLRSLIEKHIKSIQSVILKNIVSFLVHNVQLKYKYRYKIVTGFENKFSKYLKNLNNNLINE